MSGIEPVYLRSDGPDCTLGGLGRDGSVCPDDKILVKYTGWKHTMSMSNALYKYTYMRTHLVVYTRTPCHDCHLKKSQQSKSHRLGISISAYYVEIQLRGGVDSLGTLNHSFAHGTLTVGPLKSLQHFLRIGTFPRIWLTGVILRTLVYALTDPTIAERVFHSMMKGPYVFQTIKCTSGALHSGETGVDSIDERHLRL